METTLVDYSYGSWRIAPLMASDIDFGDVFGGPPRRSTIHGSMANSFTDGADSVAAARRLGKTASFRDPWASAEQKPVFGGRVEGGSRRWSLQEDFFVDIFGGSESLSSTTPRKHDGDMLSASSRGWRALSPTRPLPPPVEGFVDPSSEPTQFSLPDKLSKLVDSPAFGSPDRASYNDAASSGTTRLHSSKMSVFRFPSIAAPVRDESGNNGLRRGPRTLSQRFSRGTDDSLGLAKHEKMDDLGKCMGDPRGGTRSSRFHFPMYKWASRGVPTMDSGREVSESPYAAPVNSDDRSNIDEVENHPLGNLSPKVGVEACQPVENGVIAVGSEWNNNVEGISAGSAPDDKDGKSSCPSLTNSTESSKKEMNGGLQNAGRSESKPLRGLFNDEGTSVDTIDRKTGKTSRVGKGSSGIGNNIEDFKKMDDWKSEDAKKVTVEGSPWSSENGPGRRRRKGKVKDFIRIFNREAHPGKPRTSIPSQDQILTKKDNGTSEATEEAYVRGNAAANERVSIFRLERPMVHPEKVAHPCEHSLTENTTMDSNDILFSDTSPGQKDSSASSTASITNNARATDEDADESSSTYFTIRELAQDESKLVQPTGDCEEIQTTDAEVQQWSRGKEGNIRSLLSTLQYVLWPGSGWKPVPLVDIIEGTAVKRAYQKALLCLHPDKLQQKGAASDQKYIAEQVFEILQEAWTHFNALGLVAP